jgi:predicted ABC-type ATPase
MADKDVIAPVLWLLAGPNGAGKTSYYDQFVSGVFRAPFVNADRLAEQMYGRHPHTEREMKAAAGAAAQQREKLLSRRKSFVAETVFSHRSKLELMQAAVRQGYYLRFSYIGVDDPELCVLRVQERVVEGGHPVPADRIAGRYQRSLANARLAVTLAHWATVLDNSSLDRPQRPMLVYEQGLLRVAQKPLPGWVRGFPGVQRSAPE